MQLRPVRLLVQASPAPESALGATPEQSNAFGATVQDVDHVDKGLTQEAGTARVVR